MDEHNELRRRDSLRLPSWDYASEAWYFVTICTHRRELLFGEIVDGQMVLHEFGEIVHEEWKRSAEIREELNLDSYIVMPNYLHGIVIFNPVDQTQPERSHRPRVGAHGRAPLHRLPRTLGSFIAGFKSRATKQINERRGTPGSAVWQRGFYDHVIRDQTDLARIRRYIRLNPMRWSLDRYHP